MKFVFLKMIVGVLVFMVMLACASSAHKRSVEEVIDDAVIANNIKIKFLKSKLIQGRQINVDSWKGIVTLHGRVDNQNQLDRAIEISERQMGVRAVKSYLILKDQNIPSKKRDGIREEDLL